MDTRVDRALAAVSVGVRECCCRVAISGCSFARAAADLGHVGGIKLCAETLRKITEDEAGG